MRSPLIISLALVIMAAASTSSYGSVVFTNFASGFDPITETVLQTQGGITFAYSDTGNLQVRQAAGLIEIDNGGTGPIGTVMISFANVPAGYFLEMDVGGFRGTFDNGERLEMFNVTPSSVTTSALLTGPSWNGSTLSMVSGPDLSKLSGQATFRFNTAPSLLTFNYQSDRFTSFNLEEFRLGPTTAESPVVPEPSSLLVYLGLTLLCVTAHQIGRRKKNA